MRIMRKELENLAPQLSELAAWRAANPGSDITLLDFAGFFLTPDILAGVLSLAMPPLTRYRDCWFLTERFDSKACDQWFERLESGVDVQKVMNHLHIRTLFQGRELSGQLSSDLARAIGSAWKLTLAPQNLDVYVEEGDYQQASVTFYARGVTSRHST